MIAFAYEHTGHKRVIVDVKEGDEVTWKRNGQVGALRGRVHSFSRKRVRLYLTDAERFVYVSPRFLAVYRDGKRLP